MEVMTKTSLDVNSPKRFPEYYSSAPTSPSHHLSHFYRHFHDFQENPTTPKIKIPVTIIDDDDTDFAFDVTENWETASALAEELFHGGVIKTLKPPLPPPPKVNQKQGSSPRHKTKTENHPFAASAQIASRSAAPPQRGRERTVNSAKSSSGRRAARSLSPLRDGQQLWEEEEEEETEENACSNGCASAVKGNKKWRLKDLFLFRSASEGRAGDKDPLRKYTAASGSSSRRRVPISAHELHYTANRAVSHDLKKKTFLPYKQGILGRLAFNPAVHALANGFGFSRN